jgi:hypothetical protein
MRWPCGGNRKVEQLGKAKDDSVSLQIEIAQLGMTYRPPLNQCSPGWVWATVLQVRDEFSHVWFVAFVEDSCIRAASP